MPAQVVTPSGAESGAPGPVPVSGVVAAEGARSADAEAIVRRSGSSFYWGMRLLPPTKRAAMYAIYAFCREVDDIADEPGPPASKLERLRAWRLEIERLYQGAPRLAVTMALRPAVEAFALRREDLLAVIDGMETDAAPRIRFQTMAELSVYCDRVACAVGRLSVRVFGVPEPAGDALADALGRALQLTNILRDVDDDALRDRLYLPAELLARHGIADRDDVHAVVGHPALGAALAELAALADAEFDRARRVMASCDRRSVRPAVIMMEVYHRMLKRLVRCGWRRGAEPVALTAWEKLWIALRFGVI
jgi:phytoene synthase